MGVYKPIQDLDRLRNLMKNVDRMFAEISMTRAETWKQDLWDKYMDAVHPTKIIALIDELKERREQRPTPKPQPSAVVMPTAVNQDIRFILAALLDRAYTIPQAADLICAKFPSLQHTTVGPGLTEEEKRAVFDAKARAEHVSDDLPIGVWRSAQEDRRNLLAIIDRLLGEAGEGK